MGIRLKYIDVNGVERIAVYVGPGMTFDGPADAPAEYSERWRLDDGSVIQLPARAWVTIGVSSVFRYEIDEGSTDDLPN